MIPIISQRRVDLAHRERRMLEMQLFGAPAVCQVVEDDLDYLQIGAGDDWYVMIVQNDMFVAGSRQHDSFSTTDFTWAADLLQRAERTTPGCVRCGFNASTTNPFRWYGHKRAGATPAGPGRR